MGSLLRAKPLRVTFSLQVSLGTSRKFVAAQQLRQLSCVEVRLVLPEGQRLRITDQLPSAKTASASHTNLVQAGS
jgi:hypothetical protein